MDKTLKCVFYNYCSRQSQIDGSATQKDTRGRPNCHHGQEQGGEPEPGMAKEEKKKKYL
jgi:hypothetical protein